MFIFPLSSPALGTEVIRLFFKYESNNMLHQAVANLLVHVIEGGSVRKDLQQYLFWDCGLLRKLMEVFEFEENKNDAVLSEHNNRRGNNNSR